MLINIPIQLNQETSQQVQYQVTVGAGKTISNSKNFVVPLNIQGSGFSPNNKYQLQISDNNNSCSVDNITYVDSDNLKANLIVPLSFASKNLNISFNLLNGDQQLNQAPLTFNIWLPQNASTPKLSTSAIVGITVTVVVVVGLIGYIIYLVNKRSKNKSLERYHNKRKKYTN